MRKNAQKHLLRNRTCLWSGFHYKLANEEIIF